MSNESSIADLRKLFPVINHWTYLYNGSIHPCAKPVSDAMRSFLELWENGGESAFFSAYESFGQLKEKFAWLIGANSKNIVVTESTTAAINLAAQIVRPQANQNIVVTDLAFMSNTYLWMASQLPVGQLRFVESRDGKIYTEDLAALVDEHTAAVHICAVTVGSGFRFNLSQVYAITSKYNIPLIVDGAQALGVVEMNVQQPPIDFLATTASKWLMGPAGVGFLYMADRYLSATPPAVGWLSAANVNDWDVRNCKLHDDATRFQGGMPNLVGVVGALAGLKLLEDIGIDFIEQRVRELTTYLLEQLKVIGVDIWTPQADSERAGIVFFRTVNHQQLHARLKEASIYCGCFLGGIRIDPNFYNTYEELDRFISIVKVHVRENGI